MVAAANGVGGDGAPLGGGEREPEKGGRRHGESARPGRVRGVADGVQGDERKQEVARGKQEVAEAGRRWPGRVAARAGRVPVLLAEEEGDRGGRRRWAGPAGGAGQLGWLQVSGPGRLLFFLFFSPVLIYLIYFATVLNLK